MLKITRMNKQLNLFSELEPSWKHILKKELEAPYLEKLQHFLDEERSSGVLVYPPEHLILNAFNQTPFHQVKVVIVGQDPYHGPARAHGLSFSVPDGVPNPPSLKNIFKEIERDLGIPVSKKGALSQWAKQGVLLLNATLTVRAGKPMSHHKKGWEQFTDAVIDRLCEREKPVVFVLWGKFAQEKGCKIERYSQHVVLKAPHPSPLSAYQGFFGCSHFSLINQILLKNHETPIEWSHSQVQT